MSNENNVFIVNKQALIDAALELEKRDVLYSLMLTICLEQIEDIRRKLDVIMTRHKASQAKTAFLELFMNEKDWGRLFDDEPEFERWKAKAQTVYASL